MGDFMKNEYRKEVVDSARDFVLSIFLLFKFGRKGN